MLKVAIVGLPNVGKSTLFNALLKKESALAANYPFATIDPNIGVVDVPDERLPVLAQIVNSTKIVPTAIEFYDIAGLVRGASEGEGLGNKFLSHIRETALICHVVRLFEDADITHVDDKLDAVSDIQTIETELILADLSTLSSQKEPKGAVSKADAFAWETLVHVKAALDTGKAARDLGLSDEQKATLRQFNLLSLKPMLYVFNVSETQLESTSGTEARIKEVLQTAGVSDPEYIAVSAKLENEIVALEEADQREYLAQFDLHEAGLDRLVKHAYQRLNLISFLTAGEKEVRAWTIPVGTLAPQAAGVIHTDFEKNFIKAEVVRYEDFVAASGWAASRASGKMTLGGKDYVMKDGDVVEFKVGV